LTLYVDIYFFVNTAVDFLICCITGKVLHMRCKVLRLLLSAISGGIFAVICLVLQNRTSEILTSLLVPAIMLYIAFGKTDPKTFIKSYAVMLGCSFAAGGIFFAAESFLLYHTRPQTVFAICFCVFFFCFYFFDIFCFNSELKCVEVNVHTENNTKKLKLLCDSGCLVREPIGGLPVILLAPQVFDELYPDKTDDAIAAIKYKKRAVPIKTAGGSAVIYAVMPHKLTYIYKNREKPCNAMIGRSISPSFSGMDGIFPQALL